MQNTTLVWIILGALVVLGGGWYFFMNNPQTPAETEMEQEEMMEENGNPSPGAGADVEVGVGVGDSSEEGVAPIAAQVNYSASGFSPSTVTVRVGGSVTWVTEGGAPQMWVASAQHPTHSAYDGTTLQQHCQNGSSFDQCQNGTMHTFTFNKAGTWRYHNHSNSSHFGTVIVEE